MEEKDNTTLILNTPIAKSKIGKSTHPHHLRGTWWLYAYEVSWPSVVISLTLLIIAHFVDVPDFENWHYNRHNEWSFDFKPAKHEIVPFLYVVYFAIFCGALIGFIERHTVRYACVCVCVCVCADRKSTRLNSSHRSLSRMPSSA